MVCRGMLSSVNLKSIGHQYMFNENIHVRGHVTFPCDLSGMPENNDLTTHEAADLTSLCSDLELISKVKVQGQTKWTL